MTELRLEHFIRATDDFEGTQYRILDGLQRVRQAFSRNIIYPHLAALIKLHDALQGIVRQMDEVQEARPGALRGMDPKTRRLIYDKTPTDPNAMEAVGDLIRWALPHIQTAINEGRVIFEFVEENIYLEEVGIRPSYIEEGYLMLPDPQQQKLHVLQYTLSVFTHANERFRSLKTAHVKSLPQRGVYPSPQRIKLDLLSEKRDLPNPATYFFATSLDFPYEPTLLPVAKRKLMQYLTQQGGSA